MMKNDKLESLFFFNVQKQWSKEGFKRYVWCKDKQYFCPRMLDKIDGIRKQIPPAFLKAFILSLINDNLIA